MSHHFAGRPASDLCDILNGDARAGVTFKVPVSDHTHVRGNAHEHARSFRIRRAGGAEALPVVTQTTQAVICAVHLLEA